jgi:uncharacterized protein (DUF488 family)
LIFPGSVAPGQRDALIRQALAPPHPAQLAGFVHRPGAARSSSKVSWYRSGSLPGRIYTIGHSTRPLAQFLELLGALAVRRLVDIRTVPRSRHNPQFDRDALDAACRGAGVEYVHLKELGGLRRPRADSPNTGWRNLSFRGYADHMQTPAFKEGLGRLEAIASGDPTAILCAEAVPWRCHRSLVADALTVRGWTVEHLLAPGHSRRHELTPFLRVVDGDLVYRSESKSLFEG